MSSIITVTGLAKSYGEIRAVKGIDFTVEEGSLFAFLGPNGAGKSTTIDILCTLLQPDTGDVRIDGKRLGADDNAIRQTIGVVFQDNCLDALLTVEENMLLRGSFYGLSGKALHDTCDALARDIHMEDLYKRRYGKLSGGQRRRADIGRALVHTPKLLFLDEPTTGLDPQTRAMIWETIRDLRRNKGVTVFLTTHYMEEAAEADEVIILDNGTIVAQGTPNQLRTQYARDTLRLYGKLDALTDYCNQKGLSYTAKTDHVAIPVNATLDALDIANDCRALLSGFEVVNGTMDDVFLAITGREIRA